MNILVTGAAGFIGSQFVRTVLEDNSRDTVLSLDALTYAASMANLSGLTGGRRTFFVHMPVEDHDAVDSLVRDFGIDAIVNFAAESHVDRSLYDAAPFVKSNVEGAASLLRIAQRHDLLMLQVSTDEVYGSANPGESFMEESRLSPNNPYAASKAAADLMALTYFRSFGTSVVITRSTNNYGPRQHPEKFIPTCILNALADRPCPLYGNGLQVRDWLHVEDNCRGILEVLQHGRPGEIYNLGAVGADVTNLDVAKRILKILGKSESLIAHIQDRPGHDQRYAVSTGKISRALGWSPKVPFEQGLESTVRWYVENEAAVRARLPKPSLKDFEG